MPERSRRSIPKSDKFKSLREVQSGIKSRKEQFQISDDIAIYDEVSEDEYRKINRDLLKKESFIIDDDGMGYGEGLLEDWEAQNDGVDEMDSDKEAKSNAKIKASKSRTNPIQKNEIAPSLNLERIESAFSRSTTQSLMSSSLNSSSNSRPNRKAPKDASSFMENLLADFGSDDETSSSVGPMLKKPKLNSTRPLTSSYPSHSVYEPMSTSTSFLSTSTTNLMPSSSLSSSTSQPSLPPPPPPAPVIPMQIDLPSLEDDEPPNLNFEAISSTHTDSPHFIPTSEFLNNEKKEKDVLLDNEPLLQPISSDSTAPSLNVKKISTQRPKTTHTDLISIPLQVPESTPLAVPTLTSYPPSKALEENGSLLFYFLDATEVKNTVYLFGKVKYADHYVSCCLCIPSMERNVFLLPREYKLEQGVVTDVKVEPIDVYNEFTTLRSQYKIKKFASKFVERKYSFEVPGIPNEAVWLKLAYSFEDPALPSEFTGTTFSHAFGTHTSALELFLLKRKLMGPGWLRIEQPSMHAPSFSWCKLEGTVSNPKHVTVLKEAVPPPPLLTVMAFSSKSYLNPKQQQEILILSTWILSTTFSEDSTMQPVSHLTLLRPPPGAPMIPMLRTNEIKVHPTEKSLLNHFMAHVQTQDPDLILGHNVAGFDVDLLMNRLKSMHHSGWSKVGRLRRTHLPKSTMYRSCFHGRILLDTYLASKELISSSKSYSLTYLAETQLKITRPELDYSTIRAQFDTPSQVQCLLDYSIQDCTLAIQLAQHLNALSLYKQLSTICGQVLSRTMLSGRAERNEYLLLHEFHKAKFIVPDKPVFNSSSSSTSSLTMASSSFGTTALVGEEEVEEMESMVIQDEDGRLKEASHLRSGTTKSNTMTLMDLKKRKKKAQYAGGLVLEPKRGFYDSFVLVLDFNSLYPSIIQEYNLCYTTVIRPLDGSMPMVPSPMQTGLLPKLIKSLVDRRKTVKKLMKECPSHERASYNIRQLALKLTANSMYGCLGFMYSRFYCKPLAMLITKLGRDILQNTVDVALQNNMNVIYGDTDSIMIHTGSMDLSYVKQQGRLFQEMVNKKYKYLEIEMDGFFERMLLLKKKKYAALIVEEQANGTLVKRIESKGLDLVRRDWCGLSHEVSKFILHQLLESQESKEQVFLHIHDYLKDTASKIRTTHGGYPLEAFIITKSLTKDPKLYTDPQPHVSVALAMEARGEPVSVGSTIPYVICSFESSNTTTTTTTNANANANANTHGGSGGHSSALATRARHPHDLIKDPSLKLDLEWYISQQIFPPVSRLCSEMEGNEQAQLAECLGLDARKYDVYGLNSKEMLERERTTLTSLLSVEERFSHTSPLTLTCLICLNPFSMTQSVNEEFMLVGWTCPQCKEPLSLPTLTAQVIHSIRQHVCRYENKWVVCDDASCECRSRSVRVYPTRCWRSPLCRGKVMFEYTAHQLYKQLMYYAYLFDIESKLKPTLIQTNVNQVTTEMSVVMHTYKDHYQTIRNVIQRYLDRNARTRVDLGSLFSFVSTSV